jgi:hypothetical protein
MNENYDAEWRSLRRLRRWVFGTWVAGIPIVLLPVLLPKPAFLKIKIGVLMLGLMWFTVTAILFFVANSWPCPRCSGPFSLRFGLFKTSGDACPHCGLQYGSTDSEAGQES